MISVYGKEGDLLYIFTGDKPLIVRERGRKLCQVVGCMYGHLYGYNFCDEHKWVLPIPAEKCPDGFQVALMDYWKKRKVKIIRTHTYVGENLSLGFRLRQFYRKNIKGKIFPTRCSS